LLRAFLVARGVLGEDAALLARLEARAVLEALAPELPRLARPEQTERVDSFLVRGPARLMLRPAA